VAKRDSLASLLPTAIGTGRARRIIASVLAFRTWLPAVIALEEAVRGEIPLTEESRQRIRKARVSAAGSSSRP
jgi:hypothetical protein